MRMIGKIGRGLFGAALVGALGLGATQAVARPPAAAAAAVCSGSRCTWDCLEQGFERGRCTSFDECECYNP